MRKGRDGGKKRGGKKGEKTDDYSGHYVIASSRPPERRPLERRRLVPIISGTEAQIFMKIYVVVNYYLMSLSFKFYENSYITALERVVSVRKFYHECPRLQLVRAYLCTDFYEI